MSDFALTSKALHEGNQKGKVDVGDELEDVCVEEIGVGVQEQDGEENNKRDDDDDDGQEGLDLDLVEEEVEEEEDGMSCQDEQEGDREPAISNGIESIVEEKVESAHQESVAPLEEEVAQNPENVIVTGTSAEDLKSGLLSRPRHGSEIFIGGISKDTNEEDLRELCASYGEIFEVRLLKDQKKGENKGYAFVTFMDKESAEKAIENMNNLEVKGRKLRLSRSQLKHKLFIGNIPKTWEKEDLEKALAEVGPGTENIELLMEPHNPGKNRGFAFVEYYNHGCAEHARKAMSMPGFQFGTSPPTISWAESPTVDDATMSQVKGIYIRNLPENVSQEQLKQLFEHHGEVTKVILPGSKLGQPKRDFGFVHFADRESALKAIEKTEKYEIEGRELEVSLARPPTDKRFGDPYMQNGAGILRPYHGGGHAFPGAMYGNMGRGYAQPLIYGRGPMPPGMSMVPMILPDGRVGYVLQQSSGMPSGVSSYRSNQGSGPHRHGGGGQSSRRYRPY